MPTQPPPPAAPWAWSDERGSLRLRFLGRGWADVAAELPRRLPAPPAELAWLTQVHSQRVLDATPGNAGEGDALVTARRDLGLAIATADCVPVLLAADGRIAAAHAGWRGLAAGVIAATLERLGAAPGTAEAWIGPAIGACCYEIGEDVAERLRQAGGEAWVTGHPGERPRADLPAIARHQLAAAGVERIQTVGRCTRCHPELLWSYRRDGATAGRNWSVVWRLAEPAGSA
jgi:YfiH family protein